MQKRLEYAASLLDRGDAAAAEREIVQILEDSPGEPRAHNLLGLVHVAGSQYPQALEAFAEAIRLRPKFTEAFVNLALVFNRLGAHELALNACGYALAATPGHALALVNQGMAYKGLRRLDEAKRSFAAAGDLPMARHNLGHVHMLENDLAHGLPLLENRRALLHVGAGLAGRPWTGDARPQDTLLVIPEQGLGDFILMSRFFPALADRFARVVVLTPAPLARLVAGIDPRLDVVTRIGDATWDVWAPIMSLPLLLGIRRLADVPTAPWIRVSAAEAGERTRLRVGINWAGNPAYAYDAVRSTSLESLAPLLEVDQIEWVSLHRGTREAEAEARGLPQPLLAAQDFLDTARVIAGLDMVVATETAIPNLAAAMGVPTCVLCVQDVDWRWEGWYEGVTVCAQQEGGNWFGAIAGAAGALLALLDVATAAATGVHDADDGARRRAS